MFQLDDLLRDNIRPLVPYSSARDEFKGEAQSFLDANENSLGSPLMKWYNRYPDPMQWKVKEAIARIKGIPPQHIFLGNGSDECIDILYRAFCNPGKDNVIINPPTYGMYEVSAHINDIAVRRAVLLDDFQLDLVHLETLVDENTRIIWICSPNNPTGNSIAYADMELLLNNFDGLIVVDEAYIHFSDATTALDLVKADKDVVVLRTFSKIYGMAGLRCGLAIGRPDLIEKVSSFSGWNGLPVTAVAAALTSLDDASIVPERKRINAAVRGETFAWLDSKGYRYVSSVSNCFMLDTKRPAKEIIAAMATRNVFIGRAWPAWPTHVRITVGTKSEMERFQTAYQEVMQSKAPHAVGQPAENRWSNLDGRRVSKSLLENS